MPANETLKLVKFDPDTPTNVSTIEYKVDRCSSEALAHFEERSIDIPWDNASHQVSTEIFESDGTTSGGNVIDRSDDAQT